MGRPDLFAKRTFVEETERVTGGAISWQDPAEIRLERVQSDGLLRIHHPDRLRDLAPPWSEAQSHTEVMAELKLAGDHLDRKSGERALLQRQARQVQRVEEEEEKEAKGKHRAPPWLGHQQLWLVAPHVPQWLGQVYVPKRFAPGCYRIEPLGHCFLWIAANELPLHDELVPFLVARSGRALDDFGRWVATRRPLDWVLAMLDCLAMSLPTREELLRKFPKPEDPEGEARRTQIIKALLETSPETRQQLIDEGRLEGRLAEARSLLRRVLARRQLVLRLEDEVRIDACIDPATLERWLDQAVTAASVSEALQ